MDIEFKRNEKLYKVTKCDINLECALDKCRKLLKGG